MPISKFGQVSMSAINTELGRSSTAQISLDTAENGGYVTLNTNSCIIPSASNPAAMSEWRGYDHTIGTTKTRYVYAKLQSNISTSTWAIKYSYDASTWYNIATGISTGATTCSQRGAGFDLNDGDGIYIAVFKESTDSYVTFSYTTSEIPDNTQCPTVSGAEYLPYITLDKCLIGINITVWVSGGEYVII